MDDIGTVDYVEVYEGENKPGDKSPAWRWRGKSDNGETIDSGEGHSNYSDAFRAAKGANPGKPVFKINKDGEKVPVGVHATDRYSEIKAMLGIPDSEPIFILRGQDKLARNAINQYIEHATEIDHGNDAWLSEMLEVYDDFGKFANDNPGKMKLPD